MLSVAIPDADTASSSVRSGSGVFSTVYILPDGNACKVCDNALMDGWVFWAMWCMHKHQQGTAEYFHPVIHGMRIDVQNETCVAVMQRLQEASCESCKSCESYSEVKTHAENFSASLSVFRKYMRDHGVTVIEDWEMHHRDQFHNVMQNETGTCVLTDPVTVKGWTREDTSHEESVNLRAMRTMLEELNLHSQVQII